MVALVSISACWGLGETTVAPQSGDLPHSGTTVAPHSADCDIVALRLIVDRYRKSALTASAPVPVQH